MVVVGMEVVRSPVWAVFRAIADSWEGVRRQRSPKQPQFCVA